MARYKLYQGDCLEEMKKINKRIALVLCDPPYGTTSCAWDTIIPFEEMWDLLYGITTDTANFVFTASQPFSSALTASNFEDFKYSLVWSKSKATGHVHAKNKPMKKHEDVLIFSKGVSVHASQTGRRMTYNPQGLIPVKGKYRKRNDKGDDTFMGKRDSFKTTKIEFSNYPNSIIEIPSHTRKRFHPTQKPLKLMTYLLKTYSNPGDIVLDFTMGSGSTGVSCMKHGRHFIGIENDEKYFKIAQKRIRNMYERQK